MKKIFLMLAVLVLTTGNVLAQGQRSEAKDTMFVVYQACSKDNLDSLGVKYYPVKTLEGVTHLRPATTAATNHIASTATAKTDTMYMLHSANGVNTLDTYNVPKVDSVVFYQPEWSKFRDISGICKDTSHGHPHSIDLGLPSGNRWRCCNVGATEPKAFGGLYAWAETTERTNDYILTNYKYYITDTVGKSNYSETALNLQYCSWIQEKDYVASKARDAARANSSGYWNTPTKADFDELVKYCTYEIVWVEGEKGSVIQGYLLTGPNGNQIFLPAAGHHWYNQPENQRGVFGLYWSATPWPINYNKPAYYGDRSKSNYNDFAYCLQFHIGAPVSVGAYYRYSGRSVRPVYNPKNLIEDQP